MAIAQPTHLVDLAICAAAELTHEHIELLVVTLEATIRGYRRDDKRDNG